MNIYGGSLFRIGISALPFLLPLLFQLGFRDVAVPIRLADLSVVA